MGINGINGISQFAVGDRVRYKPGCGTYGYEDCLGADGRLPGVVLGHTPTRIRVRITLDYTRIGGGTITQDRGVEAKSLIADPEATR